MEQQPGQFVLGQLLRPLSWIRQNDALPGAVIQLEIPEMHVAGEAEVLSIADCPPIRRGPGSVVTGTFQHVSDEVISVFVEGEPEPIGTTSQHPFWSRDRNALVPAGELRIGEELKTALGTSTRVTSIEIRAGPETVYGLEVAGEHVYQITHAGLLVHNACVTSGGGSTYQKRLGKTPVSKGTWKNKRGESKFLSQRSGVEGTEILYQIAYPDFRNHAKYTVEIDDFVNIVRTKADPRAALHLRADKIVAERLGVSHNLIERFRKKNKFTWHEVEDMKWTSPVIVGALLRLGGLFKLFGAFIAQGRMFSLAIIKRFDVDKDAQTRPLTGCVPLLIDQFLFQRCEEGFHGGIVPAVPLPTHAAFNPVFF